MTNLNIIENKISSARKYLKILERYKKYTADEIKNNPDVGGAVERYLQLAAQSAIDLAEAVIAAQGLRKPSNMGENFYVLNEEGIINNDLTQELVKMVGFRNVIVHDYEEVDYEIVYDVLHNKLKDIKKFIEIISKLR